VTCDDRTLFPDFIMRVFCSCPFVLWKDRTRFSSVRRLRGYRSRAPAAVGLGTKVPFDSAQGRLSTARNGRDADGFAALRTAAREIVVVAPLPARVWILGGLRGTARNRALPRWWRVGRWLRKNGKRNRLTAKDIDFVIAYLVPLDLWYVVPVEAFGPTKNLWFYPSGSKKGSRFEAYREAWHLLAPLQANGKGTTS
jgi:hypothetical protein